MQRILFLGLFLTPFTSLRIGAVGPGEIIIASTFALSFLFSGGRLKFDSHIQPFYVFWAVFLFTSLFGQLFNFTFGQMSGAPNSATFDLLAYIAVFMTITVIGHHAMRGQFDPEEFFRALFTYWSVTYIFLYFYSIIIAPEIFGLPLRYFENFSPLVQNVHQAASVISILSVTMLFLGSRSEEFVARIFYFSAAGLLAIMALESGTTKGFVATVFGMGSAFVLLVGYRSKGRHKHLFNILSMGTGAISILALLILKFGDVSAAARRFFDESDGAGARQALYSDGLRHGLDSFLVGYGPGSHAPLGGEFLDAHNTALTIFLQAGILGLFVFAWFIIAFGRRLQLHFALIGASAAILIYALGGDILRRLPIWIIMVGLIYFASASNNQVRNSKRSLKKATSSVRYTDFPFS